jgi:cell division protease FtsH
MDVLNEVIAGVATLAVCAGFAAIAVWFVVKRLRRRSITGMLKEHFRGTPLDRIVVPERMFPVHIRADLQRAANALLTTTTVRAFVGLSGEHHLGGVDFATLLDEGLLKVQGGAVAGPPQYEEIDIGEDEPVQTLKNALWLLDKAGTSFAVLYAPYADYSACGISHQVRIQVATEGDETGQNRLEESPH